MNNNDKKEIINLIDNLNAISFYELNEHSKECYYEIRNAILAMSIDASQELCEDAVSRKAVMKIHDLHSDEMFYFVDHQIEKEIKKLPPVTPKQRTGHWIDSSNGWMCSECKWDNTFDTNYCPHCGAKMEEAEE